MTLFGQGNNQSTSVLQNSSNSSVASLLENEQKHSTTFTPLLNSEKNLNSFANALLNHSGKIDKTDNLGDPNATREQNEEAILAQQKEVLRKQRLEQESSVSVQEIFSAKKEQEEEKKEQELNYTREELKALADQKNHDNPETTEIAHALNLKIVKPGTEGSYYHNFLYQIQLILQKTDSGSSWNKLLLLKIQGKKKQGLLNYGTTKSIQNSMSNEYNSGNNAAG